MKMMLYSVRDLKGDYYIAPFAMRNNAEAIRAFSDQVLNDKGILHAHPSDFDLVFVGEFLTDSGEIISQKHIVLANGVDFVKEPKEVNDAK